MRADIIFGANGIRLNHLLKDWVRDLKRVNGAMKKIVQIGTILLTWLMTVAVIAGNTPQEIILASEEWENATNRDGTGLYWDIVRAVYEPVGVKPKFIIRSYNGSVDLVKQHKADAAVGVHREVIKGALVSKFPFDKHIILVLFKKNRFDQWNGQESLKGKKVAWVKGYAYGEYLEVPFVKEVYRSREQILHRLDANRIDFFIDARHDLEAVLNKGVIDITRYTVEIVMELDRYLAFAYNQKGEALKKIFDDRFPQLVESGEIEKLFAKWNW
jgi:polar amino acid transport system substrate-binding protein